MILQTSTNFLQKNRDIKKRESSLNGIVVNNNGQKPNIERMKKVGKIMKTSQLDNLLSAAQKTP